MSVLGFLFFKKAGRGGEEILDGNSLQLAAEVWKVSLAEGL